MSSTPRILLIDNLFPSCRCVRRKGLADRSKILGCYCAGERLRSGDRFQMTKRFLALTLHRHTRRAWQHRRRFISGPLPIMSRGIAGATHLTQHQARTHTHSLRGIKTDSLCKRSSGPSTETLMRASPTRLLFARPTIATWLAIAPPHLSSSATRSVYKICWQNTACALPSPSTTPHSSVPPSTLST